MTTLLGISRILSCGSYNFGLLKTAQSVLDDGVELDVATLHGIPLYDGDHESAEGLSVAWSTIEEDAAS